jgi:hypothetical protein
MLNYWTGEVHTVWNMEKNINKEHYKVSHCTKKYKIKKAEN